MTGVIEGTQRQTGKIISCQYIYNMCALHLYIWMDIFTPLCTCIVSHVEVKFGGVIDPHIIGRVL